ncbi:MAG: tetratricopeptide repeat protein [Nitrospirota bacterium]|jgi:predicted O-linked N-acetylglucosamine transferase (SPINDLY family)
MTKRRRSGSGLPSVATKVSKTKVRKQQAAALDVAVAHHQAGDFAAAEAGYQEILASSASSPRALHLLGTLHAQTGRLTSAVGLLEQALQGDPRNAETHNNLGLARHGLGEAASAEACFRRALALNPRYPEARNNLGDLLREQGNLDEAVVELKAALRDRPLYPEAYNNLGIAYHELGLLSEAAHCFERVLVGRPGDGKTHRSLGHVCRDQGRLAEARQHYETALESSPRDAELYLNLGVVGQGLGDRAFAIQCYRNSVTIDPHLALAHSNLGAVLREQGELTAAIEHLTRAIDRDPACAEAYSNLGSALVAQGRYKEAEQCHRKAVELRPEDPTFYSNLLAGLAYGEEFDGAQILAEHRHWEARHATAVTLADRTGLRAAGRRLRIGYVSPDFRRHAVATFLAPVVAAHDRERFEVFAYSNTLQTDATTRDLQGSCDQWRDITALDDNQAANLVASDEIDVLVDLTGHLARNRLGIFARRPVPVQVTYLGYHTTTGLAAIDYRLTDEYTDPPGHERLFVERLYRLRDGWLCFRPPDEASAVGTLPMVGSGHPTFGSFNNLAKVAPGVVALWSRVLTAVPEARLLMKNLSLRDAGTRALVYGRFAAHGVPAERLELIGWTETPADHFALYQRVDVCLDTFPYNGGTTTCEALWMGAPVVSLAGERSASRFGASILARLGLAELVVESGDAFVDTAATLVREPERLAGLRRELRPRMAASPLCRPESFTRSLEEAFLVMVAERRATVNDATH